MAIMPNKMFIKPSNLDDPVDLGEIAAFIHSVHPQFSECEFVRKLMVIAPVAECTCSQCKPTKFPFCQCKPPGSI